MTPQSEWARICKELGMRLPDEEIEHDCLRYVQASTNHQAATAITRKHADELVQDQHTA